MGAKRWSRTASQARAASRTASAGTATSARFNSLATLRAAMTAGRSRCHARAKTSSLPDDADLIRAGSGGYANLRMAVIRIAPAAAFEEAVRSGDPPERDVTRQVAFRINHAAPTLAHVQGFSARMLTCGRTMPRPDAAHEQHARAVIVFQVIDIGLKAPGIGNTNAGLRACLDGYYDANSCIAVGVDRMPPSWSGCDRVLRCSHIVLTLYRGARAWGCAAAIVVTRNGRRRRLTMTLNGLRRQHDQHTEGGKCNDLHALLLD